MIIARLMLMGEYIIPGQDYVPQTVPLKDGEEESSH